MYNTFHITIFTLSFFLLAMLSTAYAEYYCSGALSHVSIAQNGRVSVTSTEIFPDGQGRDVCNLYTPFKGVETATCRGWLAMLMAAQLSKKSVTLCYTDTYSCSTQPTWDSASAPWAIDAD
jgi:hypothetical protein